MDPRGAVIRQLQSQLPADIAIGLRADVEMPTGPTGAALFTK